MTHGHELRWGNDGGRRGTGHRGIQGRKKWDNYNIVIKYIKIQNMHNKIFIAMLSIFIKEM